MAIENPITSDDLTIDFATLLDLSVSDRVQAAASDNTFAQALIASLTPIQMAKAFPDYYRRQLPDISNFILGNRYLDEVGKGGFDQQGGGDPGDDKSFYDGETAVPTKEKPAEPGVPEVTVEQMRDELLEKGIDIDKTYDAIVNGLSADDPQVQFLKDKPADKLAAMGIEQFKTDDGKVMLRKAPELSDQEISSKYSGKFVAKEDATEKQKAVIDFANRWNISPQAAAGVLKIESGVTSDIAGGASGNYHGVFQLQTEQISGLTKKAGFGSLTPAQYRKLSVADQLKVMDEYYKQAGITPEFFTGDPQTDASKMWALQLAPGKAKKIDYNDPNAVISRSNQASTIEARNELVTVGSAGKGSVAGGAEFLGDSLTRIDGNATPEQIVEFRKQEEKLQKETFTKEKFHEAAPNSLEANQTPATVPVDLEKAVSELPKKVQENLKSDPTNIKALETATKLGTDEDVQRLVADAATGKINPNSSVVQQALKFKGMHEKRDREALTKYLNGDPVGNKRAWCAAFVNATLQSQGIKGTGNSWAAGDFSDYGDQVGDPKNVKAGDIIVNKKLSPRTGKIGSHVMIATGPAYKDKTGKWMIPTISGNTTDKQSHEGDTVAEYPVAFDTMNVRTVPQEKEYYTEEGWQNLQAKFEQNELRQQALDQDQQINDQANVPVAAATPVAEPTPVPDTKPEQNFTVPNPNAIDSKPAEKPPEPKPEKPVPPLPAKPQESANGKVKPPSEENLRITDDEGQVLAYANDKEVFSVDHQGDLTVEPTYIVPQDLKNKKVINGKKTMASGGKIKAPKPKTKPEPLSSTGSAETIAKAAQGETIGQGILDTALRIKGLDEIKDRKKIEAFLNKGGAGLNPAEVAWCAAVVNSSIKQYSEETGIDMSIAPISPKSPEKFKKMKNSTYTQYATSYLEWGQEVASGEQLMAGDVLIDNVNSKGQKVEPHTSGGHVGLSTGNTRINPDTGELEYEMYGGNQSAVQDGDVQNNNPTGGMANKKWRKASELNVRRSDEQVAQLEQMKAQGLPIYANREKYENAQMTQATAAKEAPAPVQVAEATPAPVQVAEVIPAPTEASEKVRKFRTGGSPDVQDDENLSVFDEDGSLKWKMNSGEGIYVKPKDTEYADEKMDELAGRVDDIDEKTNTPNTPERNQPKTAPDRSVANKEKNWQQDTSTVTYSIGSQNRAFKRSKFQNEGFHFNRSSPNSTSS